MVDPPFLVFSQNPHTLGIRSVEMKHLPPFLGQKAYMDNSSGNVQQLVVPSKHPFTAIVCEVAQMYSEATLKVYEAIAASDTVKVNMAALGTALAECAVMTIPVINRVVAINNRKSELKKLIMEPLYAAGTKVLQANKEAVESATDPMDLVKQSSLAKVFYMVRGKKPEENN